MLTPQFTISQDDASLYVNIKAPMAKIAETQVHFDENSFLFWSKPYYLRLHLPGKVVQDGREKINWIAEENKFVITVPKENAGEWFEGLDMLTKLLTLPKFAQNQGCCTGNSIEVINQSNDYEEIDEPEEFDWHIEQKAWIESDQKTISGEGYGFANRYKGILARLEEEIWDLLDVKQPEEMSNQERKELRVEKDRESFDENHYWCDLYEQKDVLEELISFKADWDLVRGKEDVTFTDEEIFKLKNLPKREYILTRREKFNLLLGLVDILYAYAYDIRTTQGEHSCESGWTIAKLSSTLSWLETFSTLPEVIVTCIQRSLSYPLYRNWRLSKKVTQDVNRILNKGRTYIIKCLLDVHKIFNETGDLRYIHNDLYITDYCIWLQNVKEKTFASLADALNKVDIDKDSVNLDLTLIEKAAELAFNEQIKEKSDTANQLENSVDNLNLDSDDDDDDEH